MYYDNGDVRVVEYDFSDEIIACSYLSVSQNVIISDLIEDGISTETEIKNIYCQTNSIPLLRIPYSKSTEDIRKEIYEYYLSLTTAG